MGQAGQNTGLELFTRRFKPVQYIPGKESNEDAKFGGIIILPPIDGTESEEMNGYTQEYIEFMAKKVARYTKAHGHPPEYVNQDDSDEEDEGSGEDDSGD